MSLPITVLAIIAMVAITPSALSFSLRPSSIICIRSSSFTPHQRMNNVVRSHTPFFRHGREAQYIFHGLNANENDNDDDDGWGDTGVNAETAGTSAESSPSPSSDRISKSQELERLQNDMAIKQSKRGSSYSGNPSSGANNNGGEKDLFIPIVTIVSVMGFTGLYGYEMLRLYSRGELYLPWEN
ncbi:hypothetical protein ACHAXR_003098 [Thalassiosira sp. AJA248-18]